MWHLMLFLLSDWLLLFLVLMLSVKTFLNYHAIKINLIYSQIHDPSLTGHDQQYTKFQNSVILILFMDCSSYQYFELDFIDFHSFIHLLTFIYVYFYFVNISILSVTL